MIDYNLVEKDLNKKVKKIILLIKNDYYCYMSPRKKQILEDLIIDEQIVIVNQGISHFNDNTLAHGGRALMDDKIHFYPDVRGFNTKEAIETCGKILPHECFHYFIQPDRFEIDDKLEREMANFYTEGLVERETRKFCKQHEGEVEYKKANYGYNINFVNMIQNGLCASGYENIFSENNYIKDIGKYTAEYKATLKQEKKNLKIIEEIAKSFPIDMQSKALRRMRTAVLQDGNTSALKTKLRNFKFIPISYIEQLDAINEKEL